MTQPSTTIDLGGIQAELIRKNIRHVYFRVYPPDGRVRISAPLRMSENRIQAVAQGKLEWIKAKQRESRAIQITPPPTFTDGELHPVWGVMLQLRLTEKKAPPSVSSSGHFLCMQTRPDADISKKREVLGRWYREQTREAAMPLIALWEPLLSVEVSELLVRRMRSRWGSCNIRGRTIRLNSELAKRHPRSLEYVVVHEMVHLLEPSHGRRFKELMDGFMPDWRNRKDELSGSAYTLL